MPSSWAHTHLDSSAGVPLMPRLIRCPRCGIAKGTTREKPREGLCRDCADVLPASDRAAWKKAA